MLQNSVGIVTGASRGIGRAIAGKLAREGMDIAAVDLELNGLNTLVDEIESIGRRVVAIKADVTKCDETDKMARKTIELFGSIDVMINNAGIIIAEHFIETNELNWRKIIDTNLTGTFLCCKSVVPYMINQNKGKIINISSILGKKGSPMLAAYCASKFGVIGLTMTLSQELGKYNITANAVCPGFVRTSMWENHLNQAFSDILRIPPKDVYDNIIAASVPLKQPITEEDIAQCVAFLCKADNISGAAINVDGGYAM